MTSFNVIQILIYLGLLLAAVKPLGSYMARVLEGEPVWLEKPLGWLERIVYRAGGVRPNEEMGWKAYAQSNLIFGLAGVILLYVLQRVQGWLPLDPQHFGAVAPDLAFNTAVSFVSNTNWQFYGGETTLSHLTQMCGLTVWNFLSAAAGAICSGSVGLNCR